MLRQLIKDSKRRYWDSVGRNTTDPRLLNRGRSGPSTETHLSLQLTDSYCADAIDQEVAFANHSSEGGRNEPYPVKYGPEIDSPLNHPFTLFKQKDAIHLTKIISLGEDKINTALFKALSDNYSEYLLHIYKSTCFSGDNPSSWTSAFILPILEPNKPIYLVSSYRPISLTSVMGKICKRMIGRWITYYLLHNKILICRHLVFLSFSDRHTALSFLHQDTIRAKKEKNTSWASLLACRPLMTRFTFRD